MNLPFILINRSPILCQIQNEDIPKHAAASDGPMMLSECRKQRSVLTVRSPACSIASVQSVGITKAAKYCKWNRPDGIHRCAYTIAESADGKDRPRCHGE